MSPNNHDEHEHGSHEEQGEVVVEERKVNVLQHIWENNKGASLILISELFGASMDAMARYLQQGDARYHTLQVRDYHLDTYMVQWLGKSMLTWFHRSSLPEWQ